MSINKYNPVTGELELLAGGVSNSYAPIGAIYPYGGTSAPSGYLMCDGSAVSRTDYSALFAIIGTSFGAGDGSTTFNVPDLRECVPVGVGENGTQTIAAHDTYTLGEFKDDQLQNITGSVRFHAGLSYVAGAFTKGTTASGDEMSSTGGTANANFDASLVARTGTTTHGKQLGVNYIIKAKDVNLSGGGQALADRVETLEDDNAIQPYVDVKSTQSTTDVVRCYRCGHLVMIHKWAEGMSTGATRTYQLPYTLPTAVYNPVFFNGSVTGYYSITVDGLLTIQLNSTETAIHCTLMFMVN